MCQIGLPRAALLDRVPQPGRFGVAKAATRCNCPRYVLTPLHSASPTGRFPQAEFREAARQFSEYKQDFDAERLREQVFETVQANKVMDWLMANCTVKVLPPRKA